MRTSRKQVTSNGLIVIGMLACSLQVEPADAGPRAWVSSTGGGVVCTRSAPCATFTDAIAVVDPGGEINCVDAADYRPIVGLTKSLTIDCTGTGASITQSSPGAAVSIATNGLVVTLRGLTLDGLRVAQTGIDFSADGELHVENCRIANFKRTSFASSGIVVRTVSGPGKAYILDTIVEENGATSGAGIALVSEGGGIVAVLERVQARNNPIDGLLVSSFAGNSVNIRDSTFVGNEAGITALGPGTAGITVDRTTIAQNRFGLDILGPGSAFVTLGAVTVMGNNQVGIRNAAGGAFFSYGDNQLTGNTTDMDGVTLTPLPLQ